MVVAGDLVPIWRRGICDNHDDIDRFLEVSLGVPISQRTHDTMITLLLRQNDVATPFWRNNDVIITSHARWVVPGDTRHTLAKWMIKKAQSWDSPSWTISLTDSDAVPKKHYELPIVSDSKVNFLKHTIVSGTTMHTALAAHGKMVRRKILNVSTGPAYSCWLTMYSDINIWDEVKT